MIRLDAQWGALMWPGDPKVIADDVPKVHLDRTGEYEARPENQLSPENVNFAAVADRIERHRSLLHHCIMNMTEWDEEGLLAPLYDCYSNSQDGAYLQAS